MIKATGSVGRLSNAKLVEGLQVEMISIGKLSDDTGKFVTFGPNAAFTHDLDPRTMPGAEKIGTRLSNGLYGADEDWLMPTYTGALADSIPDNKFILWHSRLGHVSYRTMGNAIRKGIIRGLPFGKSEVQRLLQNKGPPCLACGLSKTIKRKLHEHLKNINIKKPIKKFELLCMDICGQVTPHSHSGHTYFLVVMDVFTSSIWTIPLEQRSDAPRELDEFLSTAAAAYRTNLRNIMRIRSDNAPELVAGDMLDVYKKWGVVLKESTSPYSSYQNAYAERAIYTLVSMARTMMVHSKAPNHEWHHALMCAAYILRRLPTRSNPASKAPILVMLDATEQQASLSHLRTWYSPVFVRKQDRSKTPPTAPFRWPAEEFMAADIREW